MEKHELKEKQTYYYKNHLYNVICIGKQRNENEIWEDCVIYKRTDVPVEPAQQKMFVRSVRDFLAKFEPIEFVNPSVLFGSVIASNTATLNLR